MLHYLLLKIYISKDVLRHGLALEMIFTPLQMVSPDEVKVYIKIVKVDKIY